MHHDDDLPNTPNCNNMFSASPIPQGRWQAACRLVHLRLASPRIAVSPGLPHALPVPPVRQVRQPCGLLLGGPAAAAARLLRQQRLRGPRRRAAGGAYGGAGRGARSGWGLGAHALPPSRDVPAAYLYKRHLKLHCTARLYVWGVVGCVGSRCLGGASVGWPAPCLAAAAP